MNIGSVRTSENGAASRPAIIWLVSKLAKLAERGILAHIRKDDGLTTLPAIMQTASKRGSEHHERLPAPGELLHQQVRSVGGVRQPDEERRWLWPVEARQPSRGKAHDR